MSPETIANDAIGLFLEYRDKHGFDEEAARAKAVCEVIDGVNAERDRTSTDNGPVQFGIITQDPRFYPPVR